MTDETVRRFTLWALEQLAPDVRADKDGIFWINVPQEDRDDFGGAPRIGVVLSGPDEHGASDAHLDCGVSQENVLSWLIGRLYDGDQVTEAVPADQPVGVHQLADRLYAAYRVEAGTAHLAGCILEDRLIARFTRCPVQANSNTPADTTDEYTDFEGHPLAHEMADLLGLAELNRLGTGRRLREGELVQLVVRGLGSIGDVSHGEDSQKADPSRRTSEGGRPRDRHAQNDSASTPCAPLQSVTAIWCKYAKGKLCFTIGDATAEVAFAGWARSLRPPPISCPQTGAATFHLAATDDGRIAAAEEISPCDETGRRLLRRELVRCSVTEKLVVPELVEACPVSGERVLRKALVPCAMCGQRVSPRALVQSHCAACRGLTPVTVADPRLVRVFDEHPGLERWRGWRMSETTSVYILVASGWIERLLVVVDRETIEPLCVAHGTRLRSDWELVASERWANLLE